MVERRPAFDNQRVDPENWVNQYGDYLYRYALSRVHQASLAEDLVQETFLAALAGWEKFENRSTEKTWLTAILKHKIMDHFRKTRKEQPLVDEESYALFTETLFDSRGKWKNGPSQWDATPGQLFEQREFWRIIESCLSGLPGRLAQAFQLREMDGSNCEEILYLSQVFKFDKKHFDELGGGALQFILPFLSPEDREFIGKEKFNLDYLDYNWKLNDLKNAKR